MSYQLKCKQIYHKGFIVNRPKSQKDVNFHLIKLEDVIDGTSVPGMEINFNTVSSLTYSNYHKFWDQRGLKTIQNINKSGYVFLSIDDLQRILDFREKYLKERETDEVKTLYQLYINHNFQIVFEFDPEKETERTIVKDLKEKIYDIILIIEDIPYFVSFENAQSMIEYIKDYIKMVNE